MADPTVKMGSAHYRQNEPEPTAGRPVGRPAQLPADCTAALCPQTVRHVPDTNAGREHSCPLPPESHLGSPREKMTLATAFVSQPFLVNTALSRLPPQTGSLSMFPV